MPATPDYTLIQLMRGGKYAVETAIPEAGEPLLDLDSGTLYYGNGKDSRGIPVNTGSAIKLETPTNLDDLTTWGKYYIEGKATNLPDGLELYNKFFLTVEGSTATDAVSIFQVIHVLAGDCRDQTFIRSSVDGGESWTSWKGIAGSSISFDPNGEGTIDKDPSASLDKYVFPSYSYIQSISGGPEDANGKSGFLIVYRKDQDSPYIYQELIVADPDAAAGKVYCRLSANGNQDWNTPGYDWREISYVPATTTQAGVVRLSSATNSDSEELAATPKAVKAVYQKASTTATTSRAGIVQLTSATDSESETMAATAKAVKIAYDTAVAAGGAVSQHATTDSYGITKLYSGVDSESEDLAATPKSVKTAFDVAITAFNGLPGQATTTTAGVVKLSSSVSQVSSEMAATPSAVKIAYDKAVEAYDRYDNIPNASTSVYGITKLYSGTDSDSEVLAATPKAVKAAYNKAVEAYNHLPANASTSTAGIVQLSSSTNSNSETTAATPLAVKTAYDKAVEAYNHLPANASTSTAGIVQLSNDYTATGEDKAPTLTALKAVYDIAVAASGGTEFPQASTSVYGITKLSSATNSNSEALAATPKAVKTAYDLASSAATAAAAVDAKKWIQYSSSDTSTVPSDLPDGGFLVITS